MSNDSSDKSDNVKCLKMYDSYFRAAEDMTEEDRHKFYDIIFRYGFLGIEPTFDSAKDYVLKIAFDLAKPNIDADIGRKKGGAPAHNSNAKKKSKSGASRQKENSEKQPENNLKTNNDNDNDKVKEEDDDKDNIEVVSANAESNPSSSSSEPILQDKKDSSDAGITSIPEHLRGAEEIHRLWLNNSLPCVSSKFYTWYERTYKTVEQKINEYSHEDFVQACKNYISVVNDPRCYFDGKHNIVDFINCKSFEKFLPATFNINDWYKYGDKDYGKPKTEDAKPKSNGYVCRTCNCDMQRANGGGYVCVKCGNYFDYDDSGQLVYHEHDSYGDDMLKSVT